MMNNFEFPDISHALPTLANNLLDYGAEVGSRDGDGRSSVLELTWVRTTLDNPYRREVLLRERKANIFAQIAETMWVLSGRSDVDWLERYLPRARQFSDDGIVWRGGYGPRIRHWDGTDQVQNVISLLREDRTARRAVIQIYDPARDSAPGKDIPCNNWIAMNSRLGNLDMGVALRSNDLVWGWSGINAFEWSVLQEIIAFELGIRQGSLSFFTASLHSYNRHWTRLGRISRDYPISELAEVKDSPRYAPAKRDTWSSLINQFMEVEEYIRTSGDDPVVIADKISKFPEPMYRSWLHALNLYWHGQPLPEYLANTRLGVATRISAQFIKKEGI